MGVITLHHIRLFNADDDNIVGTSSIFFQSYKMKNFKWYADEPQRTSIQMQQKDFVAFSNKVMYFSVKLNKMIELSRFIYQIMENEFIICVVTRCTILMVLYLDRMCQCGLHAVLWSLICTFMRRLAAEPRSTAGSLFLSQCPSGKIMLTPYSMVGDWRVSRAGPMLTLEIFVFIIMWKTGLKYGLECNTSP